MVLHLLFALFLLLDLDFLVLLLHLFHTNLHGHTDYNMEEDKDYDKEVGKECALSPELPAISLSGEPI